MCVRKNKCIEVIQLFDFGMKILACARLDTAIDHDSVPAQFEKIAALSHFPGTAQREETSRCLGSDLDRRRFSVLRIRLEKSVFQFPIVSPILIGTYSGASGRNRAGDIETLLLLAQKRVDSI